MFDQHFRGSSTFFKWGGWDNLPLSKSLFRKSNQRSIKAPPTPPIIGFVWEFIVRLIKRFKCTQTAIKVYIPHKELCLSCFLILSSPMNAILVSFNVLVSQLLRRRQGNSAVLRCPKKKLQKLPFFYSNRSKPSLEHRPKIFLSWKGQLVVVPNIEPRPWRGQEM